MTPREHKALKDFWYWAHGVKPPQSESEKAMLRDFDRKMHNARVKNEEKQRTNPRIRQKKG